MSRPMIPSERAGYSAIVDRPPLKLPNDARIVFWTIVNYEVWDIGRPMARQVIPAPTGQVLLPDVPNWSWHEYGMRVGCWRFHELFKRLGIRPTLAANARICEDYPRVAEQAKKDGWEFMGHAYDQLPIHKNDNQEAMINRSMEVIEKFTGTRPVGWLGPGLTQTLDTPELLAKAGVRYIGDWVYDDEPTVIKTTEGPLVTLPYTVELNDIPMMIVQHHESDYLLKRAIDQFDRLYAEGKDRCKIMSLAIHPYISGQPHRIKYLEAIYDHVKRFDGVLHWNGAQILDWYKSAANVKFKNRKSLATSGPGLSRPSTPCFASKKAWMPGTRPGMTNESECRNEIKKKQEYPKLHPHRQGRAVGLRRCDLLSRRPCERPRRRMGQDAGLGQSSRHGFPWHHPHPALHRPHQGEVDQRRAEHPRRAERGRRGGAGG